MLFERKHYLNLLQNADGNGMIKVITGIRRCGKSFLLLISSGRDSLRSGIHEDHIIQVNLEDRRNKRLRDPDILLQHIDSIMTDTDKYYILLDEVQLVNEFEDVLNSYLSVPNAEVYVTDPMQNSSQRTSSQSFVGEAGKFIFIRLALLNITKLSVVRRQKRWSNITNMVVYQLWQDWKGRKTSNNTCVKFLKPYISKTL